MGRRLDKILEDIAGEDQPKGAAPEPPEDKGTDTPPAGSEEPPAGDEGGGEPPAPQPKEEPDEGGGEPPADGDATGDGVPEPKPKGDIPPDPVKRAEFAFRRQLSKQKEKHEKELADRDAKLAAMQKQIDEMKKAMAPKEPVKTRTDFDNDDDYINYLTDMRVKAALADFEGKNAQKEAERQENERKAAAEQAELRERQEAWLGNVKEAFGGDKERSDKFLERVAYANGHGLGQVLDNCPVAADYLINDPMGPLVFEKLLNDRATFEQVFDPRRTNPMAVYHELRVVEDEIRRAAAGGAAAPAPAPASAVPKMGRPGRQAGGASLASSDMFDDPKALRKWLREHRG